MDKEIDDIEKINFPFKILLRVICITLMLFYITYHFYNGNYGLKNYLNKQDIIDKKNLTAKNLEKELISIQNKIDKLQDNNLDSDLLDEEIRKNTSYMNQNEIVIYTNELNQE